MAASTSAVVLVKTVTVSASGGIAEVDPVIQSSSAIKNLTLFVVPIGGSTAQYVATVTLDGETLEAHSFPDATDKVIAVMNYKDVIFPPTLGGNVIPSFAQANKILRPIKMVLNLQNNAAVDQTFSVYACCEEFDSMRASPNGD